MIIKINGPHLSDKSNLFNRTVKIKRTQQILFFLISIVLSIFIISFIIIIYLLSINYQTHTYEPIIILYWILFFALGLLITHRYYSIGLFVFALLGIINIIVTCILVVLVAVGVVMISSRLSKNLIGIPFTVIPMFISLISVILETVIVIFSFKLSYLIMKTKQLSNQQRI